MDPNGKDHAPTKNRLAKASLVIFWSFLPPPAIWWGLHYLHSAPACYAIYHSLCLFLIVFGYSLWRPTVIRPTLKQVLIVTLAAIVCSIGAVCGYEVIGKHIVSSQKTFEALALQGWRGSLFWPISIYVVIVNPIMEELAWRGVVLNELENCFQNKYFGIIWSSMMYGVLHYPVVRLVVGPGIGSACVFFLILNGLFLSYIYRKTKSIIMPILIHSMVNDIAAIALMLVISSENVSPI